MIRISMKRGVAQRTARILRWSEGAFLAFGICLLGYWAAVRAEAAWTQAREGRRLEQSLERSTQRALSKPAVAAARKALARPPENSLVGRIEIVRVGLSAVVLEGSQSRTLRDGVGHIPGTAMPGAAGNAAFAGHRDTFFRPLERVRAGDEIQISTPNGSYRYRVVSSEVVAPTETSVLDPTSRPSLTLVTCYPFHYIGPAPKRFVVRAELQPS
jgi:sortase A